MASLASLAKKLKEKLDMSDELEQARYAFNKPRQVNPKVTNFLHDANYAANKFAGGVPVVGKQTQTFADKLVTASGGYNVTKPKTEFGRKAGSVAELIPATIALGGLGGASKAAKIKNIVTAGGSSAAIGGGLNKVFGGSFTEGAREGYKAAPVIQGIGNLTNPLLSRTTGNFASKLTNPIAKQVVGRSAVGGANVLQGIPMNLALNQPAITPLSAGVDFGMGVIGGKRTFELPNTRTGNTAIGRVPQMHPEDAGVLDRTMDVLRNNKVKLDGSGLETHIKKLDTLATKYLNKAEVDKIVHKTRGKNMRKYYVEVGKALQKKAGQVEPDFGFADGMMGFVGKTQPEKVPQTFKTEKFNVTADEDKALYDLLKKMGIDERSVRSFDEMKDVATELLGDPQKLLRDVQTGRIKDSEIVALGDIISTSTKRIGSLTEQLAKSPNDPKLLSDLDNETQVINQAIRKRVKGGTEAGRAVVAFRILANKTLSPEFWLSKAQKQLGDTRDLKPEEVTAINDLIGKQDRLGLARFVSLLGESSFSEKAVSLWKAGLLSNPKTHIANILSNTMFSPMETIKDIPATGFDIARSAITGTPRSKSFGLKTVTSQFGGAKRGAQQGLEYLKSGVDQRDVQKFDVLRQVRYGETRGGKLAQKYVDGVFRMLGAEDKVFREMAFNRSIADQAMTKLVNKDISAAELQKLLTDPTEDMVNVAIKDAQTSTFNNPNVISDGIRRFKSVDPTLAAGADIMMPFVRTPTNVLLRMVDYTPAGFAGATLKKIRNGDSVTDKEFAEAFGRSATGMTMLALGFALASKGMYQGATPTGEAERSQMYLEGRQPTSVRLGDTWYQVSKLSPFAQLIGIGAAYHDASGGVASKVGQAGLQGVKSFSELPMIAGLASATEAVNDPEKGGKKYVEQAVGGIIPNFVRGVASGSSDVLRAKDTALDSILAGLPVLNKSLPVRVDALGNPIPVNNVTTTLLNPFNPRDVNQDPIVQEFARVGYNLNYVGDNIDKKKLIPEQERAYQKLAGAKIREYIVPILESEEYQNADIDTQNDIITRVVNKAKSDAREEIRPLLPSITKGSDRGFKASAAEKEVEKTRGGISILKRGKDIGAWDQGNKGTQIDHKEALGLGGTNKSSNQMILTNKENQQKGIVEAYFAREVDKGNITIGEAQKRMDGWKWVDEYNKLQQGKKEPAVKRETKDKTAGKVYTIINPATGKDQKIDISGELIRPEVTGQTELDKELLSAFNSKVTTRINNIEKLYLAGEMSAEEAEKAIIELKAKKISTGKAKKKGVRVSMPKITFAKADAISKSNIKPSTFKLKKAPKLKLSSAPTRKATIKLAKKSYAKGKPIKFKNTLSESLTKLA